MYNNLKVDKWLSILRNVACYWDGNSSWTFLWGAISYRKTSKNCFWYSQFSLDYGLQPRNSTKLCHGWYHGSALGYLHQMPRSIFSKSVYSGISDYRTKTFTADPGTCLERKDCSKTAKIPKKPLQNCSYSINFAGLQTKASELNKYCNKLREKHLLLVPWNICKFIRIKAIVKSFYWSNKVIIQK